MPASQPPQPGAAADRIEREALDWFVREQRGLTDQERAGLQAWLRAHEAHGQALRQWRGDWDRLESLPHPSLAQIRHNLQRDKAEQARHAAMQRRQWLLAGGSTLGVGALAMLLWRHRQQPLWQQSFASRRGQLLAMELPDASRVQIDTATRLDVVFFRDRREAVLLDGQAAFHVAAQDARPFHVLAGDTRITVAGTRFAVRHTPDMAGASGVQVAVSEGQVLVAARAASSPAAGPGPLLLGAGQQVSSNGEGRLGRLETRVPSDMAPWRRQRVSFENTPLRQAIAELERYGDTRLRLAGPEVGALRITGTFSTQDLNNFRRLLPQVLPIALVPAPDGWTDIAIRS